MGGTNILSALGTATKKSRLPQRAAGTLLILSVAVLATLQPAFAEDGFPLPDTAVTASPVPSAELPAEESVAPPPEETVPTEEPAPEPVQLAPSEPSGEPAAQPAIPGDVVPIPPAAVVPAPAQPAPVQNLPAARAPGEPAVTEPAVVPFAEVAETAAAVPPSPTASAGPAQQQSQASPVQAVVSVATGSPLGVQLLTVAVLIGAGFAYFRVLGSKGMRTPSRSVK